MQDYTYTLKHTSGIENKIPDALSRHTCVLKQLNAKVVGFERIKKEYVSCPDFGEIFGTLKGCHRRQMVSYSRMTIYFNFGCYAFSVSHYETILFGNCMLGVLLITSNEKKP